MRQVIDFDTPESPQVVLITFRGARAAITRERLLELLENEQELWELVSGKPESATPPPALVPQSPLTFDAKSVPMESVSHASLSTRVKKVYTYSAPTRRLRNAHMELLREMIEAFAWNIPRHPNTKMELQLVEMIAWKNVPTEFRDFILAFLDRYLKQRSA